MSAYQRGNLSLPFPELRFARHLLSASAPGIPVIHIPVPQISASSFRFCVSGCQFSASCSGSPVSGSSDLRVIFLIWRPAKEAGKSLFSPFFVAEIKKKRNPRLLKETRNQMLLLSVLLFYHGEA